MDQSAGFFSVFDHHMGFASPGSIRTLHTPSLFLDFLLLSDLRIDQDLRLIKLDQTLDTHPPSLAPINFLGSDGGGTTAAPLLGRHDLHAAVPHDHH